MNRQSIKNRFYILSYLYIELRDVISCHISINAILVWFVHDDVIKWKYFPRYSPFWGESTGHPWRGIRPVTRSFDFFYLRLNKWLSSVIRIQTKQFHSWKLMWKCRCFSSWPQCVELSFTLNSFLYMCCCTTPGHLWHVSTEWVHKHWT